MRPGGRATGRAVPPVVSVMLLHGSRAEPAFKPRKVTDATTPEPAVPVARWKRARTRPVSSPRSAPTAGPSRVSSEPAATSIASTTVGS